MRLTYMEHVGGARIRKPGPFGSRDLIHCQYASVAMCGNLDSQFSIWPVIKASKYFEKGMDKATNPQNLSEQHAVPHGALRKS